ncbi:hypothetical protein WA026_017912 [Henosepilachna vigintioctopunctata]|uniref:Uncharacterized protein n=1 Tax=Henosepilachna vigintioctopunctata TaxID=420089 RepID=A0AAW1TVK5_9CUCU
MNTIVVFYGFLSVVTAGNIIGGLGTGPIIFNPDAHIIDSLASAGAIVDGSAPLIPSRLHQLLPPAVIPFLPDVSIPYASPSVVSENLGAFIEPPAGLPFFSRTFYESAVFPPVLAVPYEEAVASRPSRSNTANQ